MHTSYKDIFDRIKEEPKWFDEYAVPRYNIFSPDQCANIYANIVKLILIECQSCERPFFVCMSYAHYEKSSKRFDLNLYGDPPNIGCCLVGPMQNSISRKITEYWEKDYSNNGLWVRHSNLEIEVRNPV